MTTRAAPATQAVRLTTEDVKQIRGFLQAGRDQAENRMLAALDRQRPDEQSFYQELVGRADRLLALLPVDRPVLLEIETETEEEPVDE